MQGELGKKSEPQMGFQPMILRDLSDALTTELLESLWWARVNFMGLDWNRITRLHSQVMTGTHELINSFLFYFITIPPSMTARFFKDFLATIYSIKPFLNTFFLIYSSIVSSDNEDDYHKQRDTVKSIHTWSASSKE